MNSNTSNATFTTVLAMCQMMLKNRAASSDSFLKTADILEVVEEVTAMPSFSGVDKDHLVKELQ